MPMDSFVRSVFPHLQIWQTVSASQKGRRNKSFRRPFPLRILPFYRSGMLICPLIRVLFRTRSSTIRSFAACALSMSRSHAERCEDLKNVPISGRSSADSTLQYELLNAKNCSSIRQSVNASLVYKPYRPTSRNFAASRSSRSRRPESIRSSPQRPPPR